jgi:hypothetical protein
MSEKKRQKKDGEDKNKKIQRRHAVSEKNKSSEKEQAAQDEMNRNPNYK